MFTAPDGDLLYPWREAEPGSPMAEMALWDGAAVVPTGLLASRDVFPDMRHFRVLWSADGNAFVITDFCCVYGPNIRINHFQQGADGISRSEFAYTPLMEGRTFYTPGVTPTVDRYNAHDISDDGQRVLVTASDVEDVETHVLMIWQPNAPEDSTILPNVEGREVLAASFSARDEGRVLLMLGDQRIVCYDSETHDIVAQATLTSFSYYAEFSPDGRWLAYTVDDELYVFNTEFFCG
jgi:hypothetical protein